MKLDHYECEGQLSIFDIIRDGEQKSSHNLSGDPDYQGRQDEITRLSIENDFENSITLFHCECGEEPERYFKGCHEYFVRCPKCGRCTEHHPKMYKAMQAWNRHEVGAPQGLPIWEFLRYGPHTLITQVRVKTREWLDRYGVPDWVKWSTHSLPCENCTWYDGTNCCSGGHTNHFEYGYLICDGFYQSIVERKPSTVGEGFPSYLEHEPIIHELDVRGICDDPYCPQCDYCFTTWGQDNEIDCERCPHCHVKVDWRRWHRINDEEDT